MRTVTRACTSKNTEVRWTVLCGDVRGVKKEGYKGYVLIQSPPPALNLAPKSYNTFIECFIQIMRFLDFVDLLNNEEALVLYLQEKNMLRVRSLCVRCNKEMTVQSSNRHLDGKCFRCAKCKSTQSLRKGKFMEKSKLNLREIAAFLYLHHLEVLQKRICEVLDIAAQTGVDYSSFVREQCGCELSKAGEMLGGPGIRVQVNC